MDVLNRLITRTNGISSGFERLPPQNKLIDDQKQQKSCKMVKLPWKCCKNNFGDVKTSSIKNSKKTGKQNTQNTLLNVSASEPNLNLEISNKNEALNILKSQNFDYEEDCGILIDSDRERLCDKNEKKNSPSPKNENLPVRALQRVRGKLSGSKKLAAEQSFNSETSHNVITTTSSAPTLLVKQFRKHAKITDMVGGSIKKAGNSSNSTSVDLTTNSTNTNSDKKKKNRKKSLNDAQRLLLFEEGMAMD
uniref:Uncharacterized protein n=1 Tax=Meloidogyne javanica TaxID=6303 RepID=A0A915LCW2_MELJA